VCVCAGGSVFFHPVFWCVALDMVVTVWCLLGMVLVCYRVVTWLGWWFCHPLFHPLGGCCGGVWWASVVGVGGLSIGRFLVSVGSLIAAASAVYADKSNPHFGSRYVSLHAVQSLASRLAAEHGVDIRQATQWDKGSERWVLLTCLSCHEGTPGADKPLQSAMPLVVDGNPQHLGASITYARRFALMTLLGLAPVDDPDDDDGESLRAAASAAAGGGALGPDSVLARIAAAESREALTALWHGTGEDVRSLGVVAAAFKARGEELRVK